MAEQDNNLPPELGKGGHKQGGSVSHKKPGPAHERQQWLLQGPPKGGGPNSRAGRRCAGDASRALLRGQCSAPLPLLIV